MMMTLIRAEILKLRTIRTPWILLACAQLVVIAGVSGLVVSGNDLSDPETALTALGHVGLVSMFSLVLGTMAVAGEYRNGTITETYLATPVRRRVISAKLAVYTGAGVLFGLISLVTAVVVATIWYAGKDYSLDLSTADALRTAAGGVLWNATFAAIGVGLGSLIRNLTGAVCAALAWLALVEGILAQLVGDLDRWLPFASGSALNHLPTAAEGLPQWGAAAVLVGYAAVFALAAVSTTVRRDVT